MGSNIITKLMTTLNPIHIEYLYIYILVLKNKTQHPHKERKEYKKKTNRFSRFLIFDNSSEMMCLLGPLHGTSTLFANVYCRNLKCWMCLFVCGYIFILCEYQMHTIHSLCAFSVNYCVCTQHW